MHNHKIEKDMERDADAMGTEAFALLCIEHVTVVSINIELFYVWFLDHIYNKLK